MLTLLQLTVPASLAFALGGRAERRSGAAGATERLQVRLERLVEVVLKIKLLVVMVALVK